MKARTLVSLALAAAALALAPAGAHAATGYVVNSADFTVSVFDTATRTVTATIPAGLAPGYVAASPDGRRVYVANLSGAVTVIDTATNTVERTIDMGGASPGALTISPDSSTLYAVDDVNDALAVVDLSTDAVTPVPIPSCGCLTEVALSPSGDRAYLADGSSPAGVWVVDLTTTPPTPAFAPIPAAADAYGVAVSPTNGQVFVTDDSAAEAWVLAPDGTVVDGPIALGVLGDDGPTSMAFEPTGSRVWVTNFVGGSPTASAWAIDAGTLAVTSAPTPPPATTTFGVATSPADGVFVTAFNDDAVLVLDPSTGAQLATIAVGDSPTGIAVAPPVRPTPPAIARPIVTDVSPREGVGGERITIRGANFGSARAVLFGDTPATSIEVLDFNTIVAIAPPGLVGEVEVRVIGPGGESIRVGTFRYEPVPPPVTPVIPLTRPDCVVPDVRGLSLAAARTSLTRANCIVGFTRTVRGRRNQVVKRQSLSPGTRMPNGWGVALALGPKRR